MYILILSYRNGDVDYFGPFTTKNRAVLYGATEDHGAVRWHVAPIAEPCSLGEHKRRA